MSKLLKWTKSVPITQIINLEKYAHKSKEINASEFLYNDPKNKTWFTTLEGLCAGRRGHSIPVRSVLNRRELRGIYKIDIFFNKKCYSYIGKTASSSSVRGHYEARISSHLHELRFLPLNNKILGLLKGLPGNENKNNHQLRNIFRNKIFNDYEELGRFIFTDRNTLNSYGPKTVLAKMIAQANRPWTFNKQTNFFAKNVRISFCYFSLISEDPEILEIEAVNLMEKIAFQEFSHSFGKIPQLNKRNELAFNGLPRTCLSFVQLYETSTNKKLKNRRFFKKLYAYSSEELSSDNKKEKNERI